MEVTFRIFRFNPEKDSKPYYQEWKLDVPKTYRILDALHDIKWKHDGTLSFRRACAHGVCGSDAMTINGINQLACQTLVQDLKTKKIVIEPLRHFPVIKDLIVDMDSFFDNLYRVRPYFINNDPPPARERLQSNEDRDFIDEATKCILCGACTSSCPSTWADPQYLGPAAMLKAFRFVFDTRDTGAEERLDILNDNHGVWRCHTIFNCVDACPKEINITWALSQLKKKLVSRKL
jgi:succinate dehydrogenase / fumarate reductase iron-sulfur subunit